MRNEIINKFNILSELNKLPSLLQSKFRNSKEIKSKNIEYDINNFYMTDSISRASETMAKCTTEILNKNI